MMRAGPVVALIISVSEAANVRPRVYPLHGVACESEGDDEQLELGHDPMDLSWPRAEQIERCLATCAGMEDCAFFHVMTSVATDLDDCVAKPCDQCRNEDGCGWCMGRNVCSNECVTVDGECAATEHDASGAGVVDPCATKTDCASCNMKSICGWCVDGARNVCSSTCAPTIRACASG